MFSTSALEVLAQMAPRDLNKLKCKKCRKLLIPPVYTTGSNGSVCGRCPRPQEPITVRATTFETLAKYVQFPCTYHNEGCKAVLIFKDVLSHERNCLVATEKIIKCPVCKLDWNIDKCDIDTHLDHMHRNGLPLRNFPINIGIPQKKDTDTFYLVPRNDDGGPYVLSIVANPDSHCNITLYSFTKPCEELRYTVKAITSDAMHYTATIGAQKILAPCHGISSKTDLNTCYVVNWLKELPELLGCNNFYFSIDLMKLAVRVVTPVPAIHPTIVPEAMNAERPAMPIELPSTELAIQPVIVPEVTSEAMNSERPAALSIELLPSTELGVQPAEVPAIQPAIVDLDLEAVNAERPAASSSSIEVPLRELAVQPAEVPDIQPAIIVTKVTSEAMNAERLAALSTELLPLTELQPAEVPAIVDLEAMNAECPAASSWSIEVPLKELAVQPAIVASVLPATGPEVKPAAMNAVEVVPRTIKCLICKDHSVITLPAIIQRSRNILICSGCRGKL